MACQYSLEKRSDSGKTLRSKAISARISPGKALLNSVFIPAAELAFYFRLDRFQLLAGIRPLTLARQLAIAAQMRADAVEARLGARGGSRTGGSRTGRGGRLCQSGLRHRARGSA